MSAHDPGKAERPMRYQRPTAARARIIESRAAFAQSAEQIISMPRLHLRILSQELSHNVYASPAFVTTLKRQLLANRRLRVLVLVADSRAAARNAEPLRRLARRLSSQFQFRTPPDGNALSFADEALIADRTAYLHRSDRRAHKAKFATADAPGAHVLIKRFDTLWTDADLAADFRDMRI